MKRIISLLLAALMIFAFAACSNQNNETGKIDNAEDTSWDYIVEKGELIVGLDATFAPMGFTDEEGNIVGFDIDLAEAVAKNLGVSVKFQPIDWDAKEMELSEKKIDLIWNGMSATPERQESMNLSDAYLNNSIVIMTMADSAIKTKADLEGKTVATQVESAALEVIQADACAETFADLIEYGSYDEAIMDLEIGRVDAVIIDKVVGRYKSTVAPDKYGFADEDFGEDLYAIGMRKGDDALTAKINEAMKAVIESGEATAISNEWFGDDVVIRN